MGRRTRVFLSLLVLAHPACSGGAGRTPVPSPASGPPSPAPLPSSLPEVVARVNGQAIGGPAVLLLSAPALKNPVPRDREAAIYRQALDQLVVRELLFQEAMRRKVTADEKRLEEAYNAARLAYKDDAAWVAMLAEEGVDPQYFRTQLRVQHTVQALLEQVAKEGNVQVTDAEARTFYEANAASIQEGEKVHAAHILVRVPPDAGPTTRDELRKKAEALRARIRKGEDFAAVARTSSEDADSAPKGGDLGELSRGQVADTFEQAAFGLAPGGVSPVVETSFGFHIIKVLEKIPARRLGFDEVKEDLKRELTRRKQQAGQQSFIDSLRAKAKIETFL